ncbi:MAG: hypothetical protein ACRD2N_22275 [Vicinamibacterales bacterium]
MTLRLAIVCAAVPFGVCVSAEAQSRTAFELYCKTTTDHSEWLCANQARLSEAQKWDIVAAYCLDTVGATASRRAADIAKTFAGKPPQAHGQPSVCDAFKTTPTPLALRFDHRKGEWEDNGEVFKHFNKLLKLDPITRIPTAHLSGGDRIGIIITETNPLVFAANRGEAREDNIEAMKNLEKLLGLLGGALAPLVADRGTAAAMGSKRKPTPTEHDREQIKQWAEAVSTPLAALRAKLRALVDLRAAIQLTAQRLENGPAPFDGTLDESLEKPEVWRTLFGNVAKALDPPQSPPPPNPVPNLNACAAIFDAFPAVTTADSPVSADAATIRLLQMFDVPQPPCGSLLYPATIELITKDIQTAARAALSGGATELADFRKRQSTARAQNLPNVLVLFRMISDLTASRQAARDTLLKEEDTRKAATALKIVADRVRDAAFRKDCQQLILVNRIYLPDELFDSSWTKIRVTPLKIAVNSPYADQVVSSHPKDVSTSYRLVRKNFDRFSVAAGLVYTKVSSPVFVAIDPDPSTNRTTTVTEKASRTDGTTTTDTSLATVTPELKEIAEKERQPRAGSFGLFANYRVLQLGALGLGLQGGVGTSVDNPAFFGGLSVNAGSYLTLGAGCGVFRVKALGQDAKGQQQALRSPVLGNDDIRTESRWNHDCKSDAFYVTISVNLTGLPLFSPK